jgi:cytochrome bd-type quinol oxidase subunit 2
LTLTDPLVVYAKIIKSLQNMYRRADPNGRYVVTIACAMSGLLIANIWSLVLVVSLDGWFSNRRRIGPAEFALLCAGLVIAEVILVDRVFSKIDRDKEFAARVASAPPRISLWYIAGSAALLGALSVVKLAMS